MTFAVILRFYEMRDAKKEEILDVNKVVTVLNKLTNSLVIYLTSVLTQMYHKKQVEPVIFSKTHG